MNSLRRWLYRPKRSDPSLLAQFYFADEDLNQVAAELDSFEGRKDPERCTSLVNQLRACQARVLSVVSQMMDEQVKELRAHRDFRVKFPDDVIQENLAGQLWFGAECLAAGSSIMNREVESACMRPLARALTKNLDSLRNVLREQCLRNVNEYTDVIKESLIIFDKLFAEFELSYVSAMVPVKTAHEYDMVQDITVLFSETVQRALQIGLLTRDMIDEYDPALMFTIPRLAIVSGVHIFKDGPLNPDNDPWNLSEMFRPFQTLLLKIRELLAILTEEELNTLERALCSQEEPSFLLSLEENKKQIARDERRKIREERKIKGAINRRKKEDESDDGSLENELTALEIAERLEALALNFETSRNARLIQPGREQDHETQSRNSDSSSTSSCSPLSEMDTEEETPADVVTGDHCVGVQLQPFTQQQCNETNLCNRSLPQDVTATGPGISFPSELTDPLMHNILNGGENDYSISCTKNSPPNASALDQNAADSTVEAAMAGRAHFSMNKCDSSDSGLHSEVLSNSGSTFTISSCDSNQHVASSDVPGPSENHDSGGCPHFSGIQASEKDHVLSTSELTAVTCNGEDGSIECEESLDTIVLNNSDNELGLKCSCRFMEDDTSTKNRQDGLLVSHTNEQFQTLDANKGKHPDTAARQQDRATPKGGGPNSSCEHLLTLPTPDTIPQALPPSQGCLVDTHALTSSTVTTIISPHNNTLKKEDFNPRDLHNFEAAITQVTITEVSQNFDRCSDESKEQSESNCSVHSNEKVDLDLSEICSSVGEHFCDRSEHEPQMCHHQSVHKTGERTFHHDDDLKFVSSCAYPTESFLVEPAADIEDKANNNEVKKSTVLVQNSEIHCADGLSQPCVSHEQAVENIFKMGGIGDNSDLISVNAVLVPNHLPSPSTTVVEVNPSSPAKTSTSSHPSHSPATETAQDSEKPVFNLQQPISENGIENHTQATNPSSSVTHTPCSKANCNGVKGTSKTRNFKKGSKVKRQQRDTGTVHGHGQKLNLPGQAKALIESHLLDSECNHSSETSSYTSDCGDQEEIDLAIRAAENATRHQVRARFQSSSDMIHRLFVCISGVADQLQTNFAGDLRNILRAVFDMNCSEPIDTASDKCKDTTPLGAAYRAMSHASRTARRARSSSDQKQEPPSWIPDEQTNECMSCQVPFTFVRRRHHCRNCGKIFCSRCSSNFVPLPHFGQDKAVRVCNRCFMFHVTPFTVRTTSQ